MSIRALRSAPINSNFVKADWSNRRLYVFLTGRSDRLTLQAKRIENPPLWSVASCVLKFRWPRVSRMSPFILC